MILDVRQFFNGTLVGEGVLRTRGDARIKRFGLRMQGRWQGDEGVLDEHFSHEDGSEQRRQWRLHCTGDSLVLHAADVRGAGRGHQHDDMLALRYRIEVPWNERRLRLDVRDRIYLTGADSAVNHSRFYKWGLHLGSLHAWFRRVP